MCLRMAEKPGWMLVEGPGFNQPGPLLEEIGPEEEVGHEIRLKSLFVEPKRAEIAAVLHINHWKSL